MTNLDSILKSRDIILPTEVCIVKDFSISRVQMWELDCRESWATKHWCFWTVVLEKTLESPLDTKEIKSVSPWIFIGRTEAEAPILWSPDVKSWFTGKDPDARKEWGQEEKGTREDEMIRWHHWLHGHEFEQTPGNSEGQGSLVCWSPWGHEELDRTEWLNNNKEWESCLTVSIVGPRWPS